MKSHSSASEDGSMHYAVILGIAVIVIIGVVFAEVLKVHHEATANLNLTAGTASTQSQGKLSTGAQVQSEVSSPQSASHGSTLQQTVLPKSSSPSSSQSTTSNTTITAPSSSSAPQPTQAPTQAQLFSALTTLITNLDNGSQVNITENTVTVAGPVNDATARPIVFTYSGQTYFAYRQGTRPDFTTTPSATANTMAIINATVSNPPLEQAHLDKAAILVDENSMDTLVGYSQGGDQVQQ